MPVTTAEPRRVAGTASILELRTRPLAATDIQLRAAGDEQRTFLGHAAVFDSRTSIGNPLTWGWYEEIASGAFAKTLQEGDARFLVDHNSSLLVARVSAGDLRLVEDQVGLATEADLDTELSYVRDLVRNLEKRRITGMSFGFYVVRDTWSTETVSLSDGTSATVDVRRIDEVRLLEVSAVTFPAYDETDAGVRAMATEVRAARGITRDQLPTSQGERSAPADATRSTDDPAPADATQGRAARLQAMRADLIAARYRLR